MLERKTVGQLMEEMRLKAGAQNYHGHEYMDLQRFAEDTRHMIIFDVLTHDSPVGWKGERTRLFLTEAGYQKSLENQEKGHIKILSHAKVRQGHLLKYFPEEIEKHKGFIQGFEADLETLAAHPHPEDGFAGMEIRGDTLTDKENAGAALLDACKEVKGSEPVQIGSYRGFAMSVEFSAWKQEYTLLLKGQMTHRASLGTDPRGNLTRIDNALSQMPQRLEATKAQLDNLYQQQAAAKEEVGKPFSYEDDLRVKSARLVELDTLLNLDGKGRSQPESVIAKSARPSVLDSLKRPVPPRSPEKKPKQHEEVR